MYKLEKGNIEDRDIFEEYYYDVIISDANDDITVEEKTEISDYVKKEVSKNIDSYKKIISNNKVIGAYSLVKYKDGVLLDLIYIEEKYRGNGIGKKILNDILENNKLIYLYVYKSNKKAIKLYELLGFKVIRETDYRLFMKYIQE